MGGTQTSICKDFKYTPGIHPGVILLPPSDLLNYPTLPTSVLGQISRDGDYYDFYGKYGAAYENSMIDAPSGKAKQDYEKWLVEHSEIWKEIDEKIHLNKAKMCGEPIDHVEEIISDLHITEPEPKKKLDELLTPKKNEDQPTKPVTPKPKKELKDLPVYNLNDWMPGKSLKEDRDAMVVDIFGTLNDNDLGVMYKGGATLLNIAQYLYKSKQHTFNAKKNGTQLPTQPSNPAQPSYTAQPSNPQANEVEKTIESSGLKGSIADALQAKFIAQNSERLIQFKDEIEKECKGMSDLLNIDANGMYDKEQELFYEELKSENLKAFSSVTQKYMGLMQGENFDNERQKQLVKQAETETDELYLANFQQLSSRYLEEIKAKMTDMMLGGLTNLQSTPSLYGQNSLNLQQLQGNAPYYTAQPIQIINLADLTQFQPMFQPQLQNMQFVALNI